MKFDYLIIGSGIAGISAAETLRKFNKECTIGLVSNEPHAPYSKVLLPFYLKGKIKYEQLFIRGKYNISADEKINSHASRSQSGLPAILCASRRSRGPMTRDSCRRSSVALRPGLDRGQDFWQKNNIKFIHGEIEQIDRNSKQVLCQYLSRKDTAVSFRDKAMIGYGKLLIASGAGAKKLDFIGSNLAGVFYFRNLDETTAIRKYYDTLEYHSERLEPAIYGASFIALEFAGLFAHFCRPAKIFFRGPYFWSSILDASGGDLIERHLKEAGMEIHKQEELKECLPAIANSSPVIASEARQSQSVIASEARQSFLSKVITTKAEYNCNFLGLGVGLEPNLDFARQAGLKVSQGIVTDEFLQTSDKNIYAAGDIAEFYDVIIGRHHVLGNWLNSDMQGRTAAMNMVGRCQPFELVSSHSFTFPGQAGQGAFSICMIGDTISNPLYEQKLYTADRQHIKVYSKNGICVGAILINSANLRARLTDAIKRKLTIQDIKIWFETV